MIFVFTGNGKGKTTAAIGQAIRAIGQGKKVALIQFIKSPQWVTGEEKALKKFAGRIKILKGGKGFVGIMGDKLPRSEHRRAAYRTWQKAKKIIKSRQRHLIILDEINVALDLKLLSTAEILDFLRKIPQDIDVICTGRNCPKKILRIADLVSECRELKHPFRKGKWGERGREF